MSALTFTIDAIGSTAGQAVGDVTTGIQVYGAVNGAKVTLEVSHNDDTYSVVQGASLSPGYFALTVPTGWYIRITAEGSVAPDMTAVVE